MMASSIIFNSVASALSLPNKSLSTCLNFSSLHPPQLPALRFSGQLSHRKTRGLTAVTRAGASATSYVIAFALPLSLLAITIFVSIKIDEDLDRKFYEEVAIDEAIREVDEEEAAFGISLDEDDDDDDDDGISLEEDGDVGISLEKEPVLPRTRDGDADISLEKEPVRTRNRPKREA
ncbi:uncharacterized protein LOC131163948 [Malania oleifera]|uniref:uncharacterized protein LOC131163948 n=1 Tax=Malania oleifera TaxID=397392 RepID=UPI0025AE9F1B|nr:uncharacterized protein LOC131163948 [Malania oleifera]